MDTTSPPFSSCASLLLITKFGQEPVGTEQLHVDMHKYSHAGAFDINTGLEKKQGILMIPSTPEGHSLVWTAGGVCNSLQAGARRKDGISN